MSRCYQFAVLGLLLALDGIGPLLAEEPAKPKPGEERAFEIAPGVKMIFCWVPAGEAQLGSPKAERLEVMQQRKEAKVVTDDKEPDWLASEAEEVRGKFRTKGFWLGKFTVTQEEWKAVMGGNNPSYFKGNRLPVEMVSWNDCRDFLKKLNERDGVKAVFESTGKFVPPHEDQWEYACRGGRGNARAYYFGDELNGKQANCNGNYPFGTATKGHYLGKTAEVGSCAAEPPHAWHLYDMHGNVYQWCENKYPN